MNNLDKPVNPFSIKEVGNQGDTYLVTYQGLSKRESACIQLGVAVSGDEELDQLIRKSNRQKAAVKAMEGLLSLFNEENGVSPSITPNIENTEYMAKLSVFAADTLYNELEKK